MGFLIFASTIAVFVHIVESHPPHIIFIVADDLGWNDVGWHNGNLYTPNLDNLAYNGVILKSSYVQSLCTPSRNCFMTGYYPFHTGLQHSTIHPMNPGFLPTHFNTLPQKLKELGYTTHIVGKWHLGSCNWKYTPTMRGFDSFMGYYNGAEDYYTHIRDGGYDFRFNTSVYHPPRNKYSAEVFAERAVEIINNIDPNNQPLYLYLPFQSVHSPAEVPQKYINIYKDNRLKITRRTYCGMVSALDEAVGNITDALRSRGFLENALIVFTTDNGGKQSYGASNWPLRGGKGTLWEGGNKGAAFVYSENLLKKTKYVNTEIIHAVDWFPTLLKLAGGKPDPDMDGKDQWSTLSAGAKSARDEFVYNIDEIRNNAAIRVGKYKLIKGSTTSKLPHGRAPSLWLKEKHDIKLFDIENDPGEDFNIAREHPDIAERLLERIAYHKQTLVPAISPPPDKNADPKHFGGVWSPGWC